MASAPRYLGIRVTANGNQRSLTIREHAAPRPVCFTPIPRDGHYVDAFRYSTGLNQS
jgi:hypothetical protein